MNKVIFNRYTTQVHLWLGVVIGIQVILWLVSGLFMTWFPIDQVRGAHLRNETTPIGLEWQADYLGPAGAIATAGFEATNISASVLGDMPVWKIANEDQKAMIDAKTGALITPLSEPHATDLAVRLYAGDGQFQSAKLLTDPPQEYGRPGPVWRIEFGPSDKASFYVDASTGEVRAVRTKLWRTFDFMWGLHIMDWSTRDNFNSWWIKMTSVLSVIFAIAGVILTVFRLSGMWRRRQKTNPNT